MGGTLRLREEVVESDIAPQMTDFIPPAKAARKAANGHRMAGQCCFAFDGAAGAGGWISVGGDDAADARRYLVGTKARTIEVRQLRRL